MTVASLLESTHGLPCSALRMRVDGGKHVPIDITAANEVAEDYAKQAASVADKLKPGSYEAVQSLALVSIAHSLAVLADRSRHA
jgi:hypothetical protein